LRGLIFLILSAAVFLNLAGWLADLWALPALTIALASLLIVPLLAWGMRRLWDKYQASFAGIRRGRLVVLALCALTRIFIPDVMGKSDWRYTLSGMVLVQLMTVLWLTTLYVGIRSLAQ